MQPDALNLVDNLHLSVFHILVRCPFAIVLDIHNYKRFTWYCIQLLLNSSKIFEILKAKNFKAKKKCAELLQSTAVHCSQF